MKKWNERSSEVAYLLNPAFCGRLIYHAVLEYHKHTNKPFPFMLLYLVLPIVLHRKTREIINSKTQMQIWLQKNPDVLIGFASRAKSLVPITNEAVEFLMHCGIISISAANADVNIDRLLPSSKEKYAVDDEISDCILKVKHIARWFSKSGNIESIYVMWGVRP